MRQRLLSIVLATALVVPALVMLTAAASSATTFSNPSSITLNNPTTGATGCTNPSVVCNALATPYPSTIAVSGLTGTVNSVAVTLSGVSYAFSQDIDALLVGPGGQSLILVASLGPDGAPSQGDPAVSNSTITFSDSGTTPTASTPWGTGNTLKPVNFGGFNEVWEAPAPSGPYGNPGPDTTIGPSGASFATQFNGLSGAGANGTWSLYVITNSAGDGTGAIAGGWSINITTAAASAPTTTTLGSAPNPSFTSGASSSVTLTATVSSTATVNAGTVNFTDGGTTISGCGAEAVSAGQATCTFTFTQEGNHSLEALYSGTASLGASNGSLTQQVDDHTTVTGSSFCNTGAITLNNPPDTVADASPYPSRVFVSSLAGALSHLTVSLNDVSYSDSQDIDALLVGPAGQSFILVSAAGPDSGGAISNVTLTLDDDAASTIAATVPWGADDATVTSKPVNYGGVNETFGPPAPAGPYGNPGPAAAGTATLGTTFNGSNPNGTWSLYVITTAAGDGTGNMAGGWCANITTANVAATTTALTSSNNPSFTAPPGNSVTFAATVTRASDASDVSEGTVDFTDGGVTISGCGAAAVSAGQASCTTTFASEGSHTIEALYSGDANFGASDATLAQQVDDHTTVTGNAYCNTGSITLNNPDIDNPEIGATPYPSHIFVTGVGALSHLSVTLRNVTYADSQDIDGLLVGPGGQSLILVAAAGPDSGGALSNVTLTVDDNAASTLAETSAWGAPNASVTSKPVNYGGENATFGPPAPAGPYGNPGPFGGGSATLGSTFNGTSPNGTWSLYLITTAAGDGTGAVGGGWCLGLYATPSITTSASATVVAGGAITDTATLSGGVAPTGTITFTLYGPGDTTCTATTLFTSTKTVVGNGALTSSPFTTSALGTYRWVAAYSGDPNNTAATGSCNDANESVAVTQATPSLATQASAGVAVGGSLSDTATLSGGVAPTGTITFTLYGPGDTTCTSSAVFTSTETVTGNGTYTSAGFAAPGVGTYRFVALYDGDTNNAAATSPCGATNESVTVTKNVPTVATIASAAVAVGGTISDTATLSGAIDSPTGTITFTVYGPGDATCSATPPFSTTSSVTGNGSYASSSFTATQAGTYLWVAAYSGDTNNAAVTTPCNDTNESVVVGKATPGVVTSASAGVAVGRTIADTATLTAGVGATGTITFSAYGPGDTTCADSAVFTSMTTVSGNGSYSSGSFVTAAAGTYQWEAAYSSDTNNNAATTSCGDPNESVVVTKATPGIVTSASATVAVGGTIADTATLTAGVGATGTITFSVYGPGDTTCAQTPIFTSMTAVSGNGSYSSGSFTTAAAGTYRSVAAYSGDANNAAVATLCNDPNESVVVAPASPALVTTASASVPVGGTISDGATLSAGFNPGGTIAFRLFGPDNATCTGTAVFTSSVTVSGNGSYSSGSFTTAAAGTYSFQASYSGDGNNAAVGLGACGAAGENVTVTAVTPTIATTASVTVAVGGTVSDTATLSGGFSPTGTITFSLFGPGDVTCTTAPVFTATASVAGNGTYSSGTFTTTAPGTYQWVGAYSGDANNAAATGTCGGANESVVVSLAAPAIVTQASATVASGGTVTDTATLTGGTSPTGAITFTLFGPANATCAGSPIFTTTKTVTGDGSYVSDPFTTTSPGTYQWVAAYGGDANNAAVAAACGAASENVLVTPPLNGFTPVGPQRICDTRAAGAGVAANPCDTHGHSPLSSGGVLTITVAGTAGVPANATAVVLHVTATATTATSYLTVWPTGQPRPTVANLNWSPGQTVPNTVQTELGSSGQVSLYNYGGSVDLVVDLQGYFSPGTGGLFDPLAPTRVCDTRVGEPTNQCNTGAGSGPLGAAQTRAVDVVTGFGLPSGVNAVVLNVTVTTTSSPSYLTIWPDGASRPVASSLNWIKGQTITNRVIVGVSTAGKVDLYNAYGSANAVIDLGGYFTTTGTGGGYFPMNPTRICDTRRIGPGVASNPCNASGPETLASGHTLTVPTVGNNVSAVVANVTVTNTAAAGYLMVFPPPTARPAAPDFFWAGGQTTGNLVSSGVSPSGTVSIYNGSAASTDVVIDEAGYYSTTGP